MTSSTPDTVHRLIRSMSAAEKRYFKIHLGRYPTTSRCGHAALFDDLAATEPHDNDRLLARYGARKFSTPFPVAKRRLYEAVLDSLSEYHAQHSLDSRLRRMLEQVGLLHDRALYAEAAKLLKQASRLAEKHERNGVLVDILRWERRLLEHRNYAGSKPNDLAIHETRARELLQRISTVDHLWMLKSRAITGLYRTGQARRTTDTKELQRLAEEAGHIASAHPGGAQGRYLRTHLLGIIAFTQGDLDRCLVHLHENLSLLREERAPFMDEPWLLLSVLGNLAWVSARLGLTMEGRGYLDAFRKAPEEMGMPETEDLERKLFAMSLSLELALYLREGDFQGAVALEPVLRRGLDRHGNTLGTVRRAALQFQLAHAFFGYGDAENARRWCHRLLQEAHPHECRESMAFARMLLLLIHWERGNKRDLSRILRTMERQFLTQQCMHRFEQGLFKLFHELIRAREPESEWCAFSSFLDLIRALETDPLERVVFDHFDPVAWATSQLTGRPYGQLVKDRCAQLSRAA